MLTKRHASARDLDGVIDLERLRSGSSASLERDAARFLELTWPSSDVHALVGGLSHRFNGGSQAGTILAHSAKGLGKSHALLLGYHLFSSPGIAREWAGSHGYDWTPPDDTLLVVRKLTDRALPDDALWLLVAEPLGADWPGERPPDLDALRTDLGDRHVVLILDELERGIGSIRDPARQQQNLGFLQMLSEEANRGRRITLFAAVYDGSREPGSTLKRTPRIELRFRDADDRAAIVRHRLFSNADTCDRDAARTVVRSYVNTWRKFGIETPAPYLERMERAFPFLPDLIELIFERITESGGFQGTRSALGLLGAMLDAMGGGGDGGGDSGGDGGSALMSAAHCKVTDRACTDRLQDLDPTGTLINCAASNQRDLAGQPFSEAIASAVLLASVVPGGGARGLGRDDLVRHVTAPGADPNRLHAGMDAFSRFGTNFHEREGRFFFDSEENEYAKVELEAVKLNDETARAELVRIWQRDVFRDTRHSVVFQDPATTRQALEALDRKPPRYVLAPRRLSAPERHGLYTGLERRNQILLLEPRDARVDHLAHPDMLALARGIRAASQLAESASSGERRNRFERIARERTQEIVRLLKSAGLVYVRIDEWAEAPDRTVFEEESLGSASTREEVLTFLRTRIFPGSLFEEHLRDRLDDFFDRRVDRIDRVYRNTLGFPVPLTVDMVSKALVSLAGDPARIAGLQHTRGHFCAERVSLTEPELAAAVLVPPWPASAPRPEPRPPGAGASPEATPPGGDAGSKPETEPGGEPPSVPDSPAVSDPPGAMTEERATPHCRGRGELRQQTAARLVDVDDPVVHSVRFTIYASYTDHDLASQPAAWRGALSGTGDLDVQIDVTVQGPMDKATLEQHCEQLPDVPDATYAARFRIEAPAAGEAPAVNVAPEAEVS